MGSAGSGLVAAESVRRHTPDRAHGRLRRLGQRGRGLRLGKDERAAPQPARTLRQRAALRRPALGQNGRQSLAAAYAISRRDPRHRRGAARETKGRVGRGRRPGASAHDQAGLVGLRPARCSDGHIRRDDVGRGTAEADRGAAPSRRGLSRSRGRVEGISACELSAVGLVRSPRRQGDVSDRQDGHRRGLLGARASRDVRARGQSRPAVEFDERKDDPRSRRDASRCRRP